MVCYPNPTTKAIFLLLVFITAASATGPTVPPLFVYDEFVSISFFPFGEPSGKHGGTDLRRQIVSNLEKRPMFDYAFYCPEGKGLESLYRQSFKATKDNRLWPIAEYWHAAGTQYVIFGRYSSTRDQIAVEVFLYKAAEEKMLIARRYRAPNCDVQELTANIARDIERTLFENEPRIKLKNQGKP
jgi:hypothetical protein